MLNEDASRLTDCNAVNGRTFMPAISQAGFPLRFAIVIERKLLALTRKHRLTWLVLQ